MRGGARRRHARQRHRAGDPRASASTRAQLRRRAAATRAGWPAPPRAEGRRRARRLRRSPRWWPTPACTGSTRRAIREPRAGRAQDPAPVARQRSRGARDAGARGLAGPARQRARRARLRARARARRRRERALHRVRLAWRPHAGADAARPAGAAAWPRWWPPPSRSPGRWAGCTATAWCIATSSPATCTWATTAAGASSTWASRCPAARARRSASCMPARRATSTPSSGRAPRADAGERPVRARRHALPVAGRAAALRRDRALPGGALPARPACALSRIRPDVPIWLDHLVRKAVARDPRQRFETAEELLLALERGASRPVGAPAATPLIAARSGRAVEDRRWPCRCCSTRCWSCWLLFLPR